MSTLSNASYASPLAHKAKHALRWPARVAALALLCVSACGKDDEPANTGGAGSTAGVSGSKAGTTGSSGTAGSTTPPPAPVPCGTATCNPPSNPLSGLLSSFGGGAVAGLPTPVACCLEESSGKCGVAASAGATCEPPAVADSRCPGIAAGAAAGLGGAGNMVGCCLNNKCGQDGALFGRGCVENSEAKGMLSAIPLVGGLLMVPPARACDAPQTGADAGVEDAGI
jgi:hypothetical protein